MNFTGFALDQFQERARRDGFNLLILATETMKHGDGSGLAFDRLERLAKARNIPVIDLYSFNRAHGGRGKDGEAHREPPWSLWDWPINNTSAKQDAALADGPTSKA